MKNPAAGFFNRSSRIWKLLGKNPNDISTETSSSSQTHANSCPLNSLSKVKFSYTQQDPDTSLCTCATSATEDRTGVYRPNDSGRGLDIVTRVDFLNKLPYEIGAYILNFVDVRTLGRVAQTCHGWNTVCQDNELWREMFRRREQWKIRLPSMVPPRNIPSEPPIRKRKPLPLYHSRANSKNSHRGSRASLFNVGDRRGSTASLANVHAQIAESELQLLSSLDWRELYRQRHILEIRWQRGNVNTKYLAGHTDSVYCIQFDNRKIVTGSRDRTIKFWDINSGECYYSMTGHDASVLCLHYDDKILVTGSSDTTIIIWALQTCVQIHRLYSHSQGVLDICFAANTIVSCSKDAAIKLWDRHTGNLLNTLGGHRGPVNAVQLHNGIIASASGDSYVKLWNASTGECIRDFVGHERGLACVRYNGTYIVSGSNDKTIKVWDPQTGKCLRTLAGHLDLVRSLHFDSTRIVSGSYDQTIRVWDTATGKCLLDLRNGHASWVFDVEFDLSKIISTSQDQKILVWDFGTEDMNIDLFAS